MIEGLTREINQLRHFLYQTTCAAPLNIIFNPVTRWSVHIVQSGLRRRKRYFPLYVLRYLRYKSLLYFAKQLFNLIDSALFIAMKNSN